MSDAELRDLAERIRRREADDTTDLCGDDYRWYQRGQEDVAAWLERQANGGTH